MFHLLDCTLRDGGFVNNWEFGYSSIRNIVSRLDSAGIEIIEVGFINDKRQYDKNSSIFPDVMSINRTFADICVNQAMLVAMIDYGTCAIDSILLCKESILDGIRVIFKKKDIDDAIEYCAKIKKKGYKVFLNPVSLTSYTDKEILELVDKINVIEPFAMSIVDTYGLMLREEITHYVDIIDRNLIDGTLIAYHSHNNQEMAFANCSVVMDYRAKHDVVIDTTLFGMGKSAGNARTELVSQYANRVHKRSYDNGHILECIYSDIMRIYQQSPWGYNLHYYLSATNDCHPDYIQFLLKRNTLTIQGINKIIGSIPKDNKLIFSETLIKQLYFNYHDSTVDDSQCIEKLRGIFTGKNILLVFPGLSTRTHSTAVKEHIAKYSPLVISINFLPSQFEVDYIFTGNKKRYDKLSDYYFGLENKPSVIATSNILESNIPITYLLNYESLLLKNSVIADNSAVLCLNLLDKCGVNEVSTIGLDGFSENPHENFSERFMEMYDSTDTNAQTNIALKDFIIDIQDRIRVKFITKSIFDGRNNTIHNTRG